MRSAIGLRPQRQELRQLAVEADDRQAAAVRHREGLVRGAEVLPAGAVDVLDREPGRRQQVGVRHRQLHGVELRDAVDVAVEGHLVERGLHEHAGVDALTLDAVLERKDRTACGERADLIAVGIDEIGRVPRGDGRQELLQIEVALGELHLDIRHGLLREVHPRRGDFVDPREAHDLEGAALRGIRIVVRFIRLAAARADGAARQRGRHDDGAAERRPPRAVSCAHVTPPPPARRRGRVRRRYVGPPPEAEGVDPGERAQ